MPKGIPKDLNNDPRKKKYKSENSKNSGRKKIPLDWNKIEALIINGASGKQIASNLGIDSDTLYNRCKLEMNKDFSAYWVEKWEKGNANLHVTQYQKAIKGNVPLLIWLGKQRLKQSDKLEQNIKGEIEISQKAIIKVPDNGNR